MRTLSIFRHAKADRENAPLNDFERPLMARGRDAAHCMGVHLRREGFQPELVLCSPSARTRETFELAFGAKIIGYQPEVRFEGVLYLASAQSLLKRVRGAPSELRHLMLIGHNPGLQMLALELIGHGEAKVVENVRCKLPTAAVVVLAFEGSEWGKTGPGKGQLAHFMTPRVLLETARV